MERNPSEAPGSMTTPAVGFLHDLSFADLPEPVVRQTQTCILDLLGVAAAGRRTRLSGIAHRHAIRYMAAGHGVPSARLLFDGGTASPAGAAFAGAATIDAFDAHDGHALTKGHAGVAVLPAVLGFADAVQAEKDRSRTGRSLLTAVVVGYELAIRAGIALHATACDYHTSGAWNAIACAAVGARMMGLEGEATRHALGIAEFHGPRSPMMRCIDHPTMPKDGSSWGAFSGVTGALLASDGFTGAPAMLVEDAGTVHLWADLGSRWRILEQYFKPHPVCRWAQPAIEAMLNLRRRHDVRPERIECIRVETFHEAARLAARTPATTEEAQYSLPFPVAAAAVRGRVGAEEIAPEAFTDSLILRLSRSVELTECAEFNARFPAERWARVTLLLDDGTSLTSDPTTTRGDPDSPLSPAEMTGKFRELANPVLGETRAGRLEALVAALHESASPEMALMFAG
jgi:2-methylcitrate dehydratase PrpD